MKKYKKKQHCHMTRGCVYISKDISVYDILLSIIVIQYIQAMNLKELFFCFFLAFFPGSGFSFFFCFFCFFLFPLLFVYEL